MSKTKKSGPAIFMYCVIAIAVITSILCFMLYYGGFYKEEGKNLAIKLSKAAKELVNDKKLREYYSEKLMRLVDGKGCQRIADEIIHV